MCWPVVRQKETARHSLYIKSVGRTVAAQPHWTFTTPHADGEPHNALRAFNAGLSLYQS